MDSIQSSTSVASIGRQNAEIGRNFVCYVDKCTGNSAAICNQSWRSRWATYHGCGRHFCRAHGQPIATQTSRDHETGICTNCVSRRWNRDCKTDCIICAVVVGAFAGVFLLTMLLIFLLWSLLDPQWWYSRLTELATKGPQLHYYIFNF